MLFSKQIKSVVQKMDEILCSVLTIKADTWPDVTFNYSCQCKRYHLLGSRIVRAGSWKLAHFADPKQGRIFWGLYGNILGAYEKVSYQGPV